MFTFKGLVLFFSKDAAVVTAEINVSLARVKLLPTFKNRVQISINLPMRGWQITFSMLVQKLHTYLHNMCQSPTYGMGNPGEPLRFTRALPARQLNSLSGSQYHYWLEDIGQPFSARVSKPDACNRFARR